MKRIDVRNIVLSALFLALGMLLPFFIMQIPSIGSMLLPMHIPVLICGFVCGWKYGLLVGFVLPILRSLLFGMPVLFPNALAMAFELAVYGILAGYMYHVLSKKVINTYVTLLVSMIGGRIVWGIVSSILYSVAGEPFGISIFIAGAFVNALPGIILQIVCIPIIVIALERADFIKKQV